MSLPPPQPMPALDADRVYLSWEMYRLQRRCAALEEARESRDPEVLFEEVARLDDERDEMIARRQALAASGTVLGFERLSAMLELSPREEDVLAALVAMHRSANTRQLLLATQGRASTRELEVGFLCELLAPARDLLSEPSWARPESGLVSSGLVSAGMASRGASTASLLGQPIRAHACLADMAWGQPRVDTALVPLTTFHPEPVSAYALILNDKDRQRIEPMLASLAQSWKSHRRLPPWMVLLAGPSGTGKTTLARVLAGAGRRGMLSLDAGLLMAHDEPLAMLRLAAANALLLDAVLHVVNLEQLAHARPELAQALVGWIEDWPHLRLVEIHDSDKQRQELPLAFNARLSLDEPEVPTREQLWESHIPHDLEVARDLDIGLLAHTYELSGAQIALAVAWARQQALTRPTPRLLQDDLRQGAMSQLSSRVGEFTNASRVQLSLDQLVLPDDAMGRVRELLSACRHHRAVMTRWGFGQRLVTGRGLVALFCGEAGTGKTLTAEILAHELGLELHIVSIPKIVSKWVGETEKNVREVFSQARAQNSMLLFDEADSLFARRVKVDSSNDHYQNMEINNLLQEIERFDGVVILTTNLETNMDPAFARRILYRIEFPMPMAAQRTSIWEKLIPRECPREEIDFEELGEEFELSGGQIKNALLRAAYRAMSQGQTLGQAQLEASATDEMTSAGRLIRLYQGG